MKHTLWGIGVVAAFAASSAFADLRENVRALGWAPSGMELRLPDTLPRPPRVSLQELTADPRCSEASFADSEAERMWMRARPARILTIWGVAHYGFRVANGEGSTLCQDLDFLARRWQAALQHPVTGKLTLNEVSELDRAIQDAIWGKTAAFGSLPIGVDPKLAGGPPLRGNNKVVAPVPNNSVAPQRPDLSDPDRISQATGQANPATAATVAATIYECEFQACTGGAGNCAYKTKYAIEQDGRVIITELERSKETHRTAGSALWHDGEWDISYTASTSLDGKRRIAYYAITNIKPNGSAIQRSVHPKDISREIAVEDFRAMNAVLRVVHTQKRIEYWWPSLGNYSETNKENFRDSTDYQCTQIKGPAVVEAARKKFSDTQATLAAARSGDPLAQYEYGKALFSGTGVEKNKQEARVWMNRARPYYQKRAEEGVADFQYELGNMLWNIMGGPTDEVIAWYKRAAAQGHPGALSAMEEFPGR